MTDWVDFFVYATLIIAVFFVYPWTLGRLSEPMLADRNPQWVEANRETLISWERIGGWMFWLQVAVGIASLTVLTMVQLQLISRPELLATMALGGDFNVISGSDLPEKWILLWQLSVVAIFVSTLFFFGLSIFWHLICLRKIPVAEKRQADLQRRSINDFVPLSVRLATYLLVIIMLSAWVVVAAFGWHDDPLFWKRLVIMFVLCGFFWFATSYSVGRRPSLMDRLFGLSYRRGEVLLTFSCQLLPVFVGSVRLYEELADVIVFNINRAMFLGIALYVTVWVLWFGYLVAKHLTSPRADDSSLAKTQ